MARSSRATRHAPVPVARHRTRLVTTGRYAAWTPIRSSRQRATDTAPVLVPPGRMTQVYTPR